MTVDELRGAEVMMAVSGGLDSCTITHWLSQQGVQVLAYTADLGQPDEERMEDVRERMLACGAQTNSAPAVSSPRANLAAPSLACRASRSHSPSFR